MRTLTTLLASTLFAATAWAAPPTPESVQTLLTLTRADKQQEVILGNLDFMARQSVANALQGQTITEKQKKVMDALPGKLSGVIRSEMSWAKIAPLYIQIYRDNFSQEEVDAFITFYRSPAGIALVERMPVVMQKGNEMIKGRMQPLMEKMNVIQQQAINEAKAAK